jgi:methyl-accepting chemotaxis protein
LVEADAGNVALLVEEITAASSGQADTIEKVGLSIVQMSEVTKKNAQNAEHNAEASESLKQKSLEMVHVVNELSQLVK